MKLYAAQSKNEQVSVLAIIETLASAAVALSLAIHWDTFAPFAVSVVVAPFLLLRTRDSTAHGVRLARRFTRWTETGGFLTELAVYVTLFSGPIVIRLIAGIGALFSDFLGCIAALPSNWSNLVARIDSSVIPQAIPGFRCKVNNSSSFTESTWDFRSSLSLLRWSLKNHLLGYLVAISSATVLMLVFLPALIYRWSLKSTFWIYLPLLWVVQPVRYDRKKLWARIDVIQEDRTVLYLSAAILTLGALKIRMWQMKTAFSGWWNDSTLGRFLSVYVAPDSMPIWQYASMVNSVLAIAMYFTARSALQSKAENEVWPETPLDRGFRTASACRRTLTTYTLVVLVLITFKQGFPPLGKFLPL